MSKKRGISRKSCQETRGEIYKSENPHFSTSMLLTNISRPEVPKVKKALKRKSKASLPVVARGKQEFFTSGIPKNAAVHFGNFYSLEKKSTKNNLALGVYSRRSKSKLPVHDKPRSEFTRQMVHKLERLAGTEYYARQISALLDETVESPNFPVMQPPDDHFLFQERSEIPSYPRWYKEPDKMSYVCPSNKASICSIENREPEVLKINICDSNETSDLEGYENCESTALESEIASSINTEDDGSDDDGRVKVTIVIK